ncbi:STAS domain-containing protein [Kibdelosporangium aridum]|uniref:Anti-sigma factor antagonist n=1 Tax=Kibdelosporangium aridum TaxID=2030 RepID=A0A1Y5YAQ0_KIBAR|nr:STAS domain-containing protein [Kibdelosporangium aridum]SMD27636.1 anti-anti-sigma factor [Kibdelosporangium aridum]
MTRRDEVRYPSDPLLNIRRDVRGCAVVLHIVGEIDVTSAGILSEHLKTAEALATSPAPVVVDLDRVTFLGSFGIATLIDHHQRCREQSTPLRLVATHHAVLRPIETCGLTRLFTMCDSVAHALTPTA